MRYVQLTPAAPPAINGVGDFSALLENAIARLAPASHTERILCGKDRLEVPAAPGIFNATGFSDAAAVAARVEGKRPQMLLLHYVGYAYQRRGVPLWLLSAMRQIRANCPNVRIGIFFHELYATSMPWNSAFWLSMLQKKIARELCSLSDFWLTSRQSYADWLLEIAADKPHRVMPVFSNVGASELSVVARNHCIAVFGSPVVRAATYRAFLPQIQRLAQQDDWRIHDMGAEITDLQLLSSLSDFPIVRHGALPPLRVAELLSDCRAGLLAYPEDALAKSSVFAAYAAHGLAPLIASADLQQADGLERNVHYRTDFDLGDATLMSTARSAHAWYVQHDLNAHARAVLELAGS